MRLKLEASGVTLQEAPGETPGSIGTVERYHALLHAAYKRIPRDIGKDTTDADSSSMAVFSQRRDGPSSTLSDMLVFAVIPRLALTTTLATQLQRALDIETAKKAVEEENSKRRLAFGLRHASSPKGVELSEMLRRLPGRSRVIVFQAITKSWEGPFPFIQVDRNMPVFQLPRVCRIF